MKCDERCPFHIPGRWCWWRNEHAGNDCHLTLVCFPIIRAMMAGTHDCEHCARFAICTMGSPCWEPREEAPNV